MSLLDFAYFTFKNLPFSELIILN